MDGVPSAFVLTHDNSVLGTNPQARAISCASTRNEFVVHRYKWAGLLIAVGTGIALILAMLMLPYRPADPAAPVTPAHELGRWSGAARGPSTLS